MKYALFERHELSLRATTRIPRRSSQRTNYRLRLVHQVFPGVAGFCPGARKMTAAVGPVIDKSTWVHVALVPGQPVRRSWPTARPVGAGAPVPRAPAPAGPT